jgi:hypothetical protein
MILSAIFYVLGSLVWALDALKIKWTIWPHFVEDFFTKLGHYSWWLNPWVDMRHFWIAALIVINFIPLFFLFVIGTRIFHIKIFRH